MMALVWQCDRCDKVSDMGGGPDDPPDDWSHSYMEAVLCDTCDDSLYEWFHQHGPYGRSVPDISGSPAS